MEWTNDKIIEFLEVFQTEPSLWDPREKTHKNRGAQSDAWHRIVQALPFAVTVEDLKKKKEALMGYYRIHINKHKKSLRSAGGTSEIYKTNWFAFEIMHSFLKPVYEGNTILNTESTSELLENVKSEASEGEKNNCNCESPAPGSSTSPHQILSEHLIKRPSCSQSICNQSAGQQFFILKNLPAEINAAKKQMDETLTCIKSLSSQNERMDFDEYDHFASMIAAKIRKISDFDEREIVMNSIQNLVFQSLMKNKNINNSRNSSVLSWSVGSNNGPVDIESSSSYSLLSNHTQDRSYSVQLETSGSNINIEKHVNIEKHETDTSPQELRDT